MKFKQKVTLLPAVVTVFLVAILAVTWVLGRDTSRLLARIGDEYAPTLALVRSLEAQSTTLQRELREAVLARDEALLEPMGELALSFEAELTSEQGGARMETGRVLALQEAFREFWAQAQEAVRLAARGDAEAESALAEAMERHRALKQHLRGMGEWAQHGLQQSFEDVSELHEWRQQWIWALGLLCILSLGGLSLWLVRGVVGPLTQLTAVASRIATEGDLTQAIHVSSDDEIGLLARSIEALVTRLRTLPVALQGVVDELSVAAERLNEASRGQLNFLTNQSRSLSEAGTTMSEIAQTSNLAASRAEMVLKVAAQADEFSSAGRQSIESSAEGLQQVRQRVEALVRGVAHLSEQAARAGEIIGSVRDLADQSNVLALNASIEAARAGDEGRGFAVVAREMRALSGLSLQSTQRIGKILLEINQAIRQAVSIAEVDSQQMEEGLMQVLTSADRLREITTVVQESSQAAKQIVASVTQQNAGIAQMTEVMTTLSQMMGDVVESTMDAEEAVGQVNATLERLKQVVTSFRV